MVYDFVRKKLWKISPDLGANKYYVSSEKAKCWLPHVMTITRTTTTTTTGGGNQASNTMALDTDFYQQKIEKLIPQYDVLRKYVQGLR